MLRKSPFLIVILLTISNLIHAQSPIQWTYEVKKLDKTTYEVWMTANLNDGWHIYAQVQPESAVAVPTAISYTHNPLVVPEGKPREEGGTMVHYVFKEVGIEQNQYDKRVSFVQTFQLKGDIKTSISGSIHFQVCTEHECLPPADAHFTVTLPPTEAPE